MKKELKMDPAERAVALKVAIDAAVNNTTVGESNERAPLDVGKLMKLIAEVECEALEYRTEQAKKKTIFKKMSNAIMNVLTFIFVSVPIKVFNFWRNRYLDLRFGWRLTKVGESRKLMNSFRKVKPKTLGVYFESTSRSNKFELMDLLFANPKPEKTELSASDVSDLRDSVDGIKLVVNDFRALRNDVLRQQRQNAMMEWVKNNSIPFTDKYEIFQETAEDLSEWEIPVEMYDVPLEKEPKLADAIATVNAFATTNVEEKEIATTQSDDIKKE